MARDIHRRDFLQGSAVAIAAVALPAGAAGALAAPAGGRAHLDSAIEEAWRAVGEP